MENLYEILGCNPSSNTEQILAEYRIRARNLHPDKSQHPVNDDVTDNEKTGSLENFQLLQYAKEILCNESKRRHYDLFLQMAPGMSLKEWMENQEKIQQSLHWAQTKPQEQLPSAQSSDQQQVCDGEESTGTIQSQQPCAKHFDNIGWKSHNTPLLSAFRAYRI